MRTKREKPKYKPENGCKVDEDHDKDVRNRGNKNR